MGLEQTLDEYLSGKDGQVQYQQTVDGSILPGTTQVFEEAEDGKDVDFNIRCFFTKNGRRTDADHNGTK